jgi:hypothetical protein
VCAINSTVCCQVTRYFSFAKMPQDALIKARADNDELDAKHDAIRKKNCATTGRKRHEKVDMSVFQRLKRFLTVYEDGEFIPLDEFIVEEGGNLAELTTFFAKKEFIENAGLSEQSAEVLCEVYCYVCWSVGFFVFYFDVWDVEPWLRTQ